MNRRNPLQRIASEAATAGDWVLVVPLLSSSFAAKGVTGCAILIAAASSGNLAIARLIPRGSRIASLLAPAAAAGMYLVGGTLDSSALFAVGFAAGAGAAAGGRTLALTSGLAGGPGWTGVAAAASAVLVGAAWGAESLTALAGALLLAGVAAAPAHEARSPSLSALLPAQLGASAVAGMRAAEPYLATVRSGARSQDIVAASLFAFAWAAGLLLGSRAGPRGDARLVLGASFVSAGLLGAVGGIDGPSLLFFYAAIAASIAFVCSAGSSASRVLWEGTRWVLPIGASTGAIWTGWAMRTSDFGTAAGLLAALALFGGFVTLSLASRIPAHKEADSLNASSDLSEPPPLVDSIFETPPPPGRQIASLPSVAQAEQLELSLVTDDSALADAVARIRAALVEARSVREEAFAQMDAISSDPGERARKLAVAVIDDLERNTVAASETIRSLSRSRA